MVITHEMELEALEGREVEVIDPYGWLLAGCWLSRHQDAGRVYWRVADVTFELRDIADIAGTVIELRRASV